MCRCSTPREKHNFVYFCIHTWVFNCPSLMQVSQNCPDLGVFFTRAFGSLSPGVSQQEQSCATQPWLPFTPKSKPAALILVIVSGTVF